VIVIPAIDLMDGKVVRLSRGDFATRTIYSDRPAEFAEAFRKAGARRVHVVDLDGARAGRPVNTGVVRAIVATGVEV
jgi:phosphoribosylformimino-5-aminoimidazole carboxamide ribotide isomerase